jgi:hypothetical protein
MTDTLEYNARMRDYYSKRKFLNALNCHNSERKKYGYARIDMEEYKRYRDFFGVDSLGRVMSCGKISNILIWEFSR